MLQEEGAEMVEQTSDSGDARDLEVSHMNSTLFLLSLLQRL
jgi:hypothetical protein